MRKPERLHEYKSLLMDTGRWADFKPRKDDIFVCTSYKAGTTWTQTICALLIFQQPELPGRLSDLSPWIELLTKPIEEVLATYEAQRRMPTDLNALFHIWLSYASFDWEQYWFPFWSHFSIVRSFWE